MSDFNDIGISRELDWPRIKKLLTIGLFFYLGQRPFCRGAAGAFRRGA